MNSHPQKTTQISARGTALVTGASAGIGREFCRQLAARGHDIVAVARRAERLAELAHELTDTYGIRVIPLTVDLAAPGAVAQIMAALTNIDIEILVNNAGYGVPGRYLSSPWLVHARFQRVMIEVVAELCHALLPSMSARGQGSIINVASLAGFLPGTAGHTLYAAAKAWMIRFSESLAFELTPAGVRVCAVCPGFTYSEFHDVTGTRAQVGRLPSWLWMSAAAVVSESLAASAAGRVVYVPGRVNRLIAAVAGRLPLTALHALAQRGSRRFRDTR